MQVGKFKNENLQILEHYENYGFKNKTKMLDYALDLLRDKLKKRKRRSTRKDMLTDYANDSEEIYFNSIEGEDFE